MGAKTHSARASLNKLCHLCLKAGEASWQALRIVRSDPESSLHPLLCRMASKTGRTSSRTSVLQSRLCSRKFTACMNYEAVCLPDDQEREQSEEFSSLLEGVQEFCDKAPSAVFLLGIMLVAIAVLSLCIWLAWSAYSADIAAFYKEAASAGGGESWPHMSPHMSPSWPKASPSGAGKGAASDAHHRAH
eukprot:s492_g6.t1